MYETNALIRAHIAVQEYTHKRRADDALWDASNAMRDMGNIRRRHWAEINEEAVITHEVAEGASSILNVIDLDDVASLPEDQPEDQPDEEPQSDSEEAIEAVIEEGVAPIEQAQPVLRRPFNIHRFSSVNEQHMQETHDWPETTMINVNAANELTHIWLTKPTTIIQACMCAHHLHVRSIRPADDHTLMLLGRLAAVTVEWSTHLDGVNRMLHMDIRDNVPEDLKRPEEEIQIIYPMSGNAATMAYNFVKRRVPTPEIALVTPALIDQLHVDYVAPTDAEPRCAICLEKLKFDDLAVTPCGHMFCATCLTAFARDKGSVTCPNCQRLLAVTELITLH